jgi:hypothetical protein
MTIQGLVGIFWQSKEPNWQACERFGNPSNCSDKKVKFLRCDPAGENQSVEHFARAITLKRQPNTHNKMVLLKED